MPYERQNHRLRSERSQNRCGEHKHDILTDKAAHTPCYDIPLELIDPNPDNPRNISGTKS